MTGTFLVLGAVAAAAAVAAATSSPEQSAEETRHLRGGSSGNAAEAEVQDAVTARGNVTGPALQLRSSPNRPYCIKVVTGHSANNEGTLTWSIRNGDALTVPFNGHYARGQTVLEECFFDARVTLMVENPTSNAWAGSALFSADGGQTYDPMRCDTCTRVGGTDKFVVDGNADSGDQATTRCFNGARCNIVPAAPQALYCVRVVTGHSGNNDGTLTWYIQTKGSITIPVSDYYAKGQTVLEECFVDAMLTLIVQNPTSNAWTGSASFSADGGQTYNPMQCETCTRVGVTDTFVVDGDADSGDQAATRCFNGASCNVVPRMR